METLRRASALFLLAAATVFVAGPRLLGRLSPPQVGAPAVTAARPGNVECVPYSADEITETTQVLADGTQIIRKTLTKVYRDSQGRTRRDFYGQEPHSPEIANSPSAISIIDPVAGVTYSLDTRTHRARAFDMRPPVQPAPVPPANSSASKPAAKARAHKGSSEDLGEQTIEGFVAHGTRQSATLAAGEVGNDRPIQIVTEHWVSPELRAILLASTDDPRRGKRVQRLTNISREEPSPDVFQVPPDYTIVEEQPVDR